MFRFNCFNCFNVSVTKYLLGN